MSDVASFYKYNSDLKTQSAVERQLGIVGEAVNKFIQESFDNNLINARQIIGFRNRIIHSYDSVDSTIVWVIVNRYLKPLKEEVQEKLNHQK